MKVQLSAKGKPDVKGMDLDILDELIGKCEDSMVSPFKKKKEGVLALEVRPEEGSDEEESSESPGEEKAEGDGKPDLSDVDMDDLLRMYQEMKDRK